MASGAGSCPTKDLVSRNGAIHEAVQRGRLADVEEVVRKDWAAVNEPGAQQVRSPPPPPPQSPALVLARVCPDWSKCPADISVMVVLASFLLLASCRGRP